MVELVRHPFANGIVPSLVCQKASTLERAFPSQYSTHQSLGQYHNKTSTSSSLTYLKSLLFVKSDDLGGNCYGPVKDLRPKSLRPNNNYNTNATFGNFTRNTPPLREGGCSENLRPVQMNCNVSFLRSHDSLPDG